MLADKEGEWAQNFIAKEYQSSLEQTPETQKQIESATHNMETIDKTITFLRSFIKAQGGKDE